MAVTGIPDAVRHRGVGLPPRPIQGNQQVSKDLSDVIGRVLPAPENHLSAEQLEQARKARRRFMGKALAMGAGVAAYWPDS